MAGENCTKRTDEGHGTIQFKGKARSGLIEQASGGTLLLDEIEDLALPFQIKLLRLLQEREYLPQPESLASPSRL